MNIARLVLINAIFTYMVFFSTDNLAFIISLLMLPFSLAALVRVSLK